VEATIPVDAYDKMLPLHDRPYLLRNELEPADLHPLSNPLIQEWNMFHEDRPDRCL
jgi:hypothetical protein